MKITNKFLQILGAFCFLAGVIIGIILRKYNASHPETPISYGSWISIAVMIIGLILLMPWVKNKDQK
jgi:ACR3 family arsenite efflux pump ArsB